MASTFAFIAREYELCQFKSWQIGKKLEWTPVRNIEGREKAIDDLLSPPETGNCDRHLLVKNDGPKPAWTIPPGRGPARLTVKRAGKCCVSL